VTTKVCITVPVTVRMVRPPRTAGAARRLLHTDRAQARCGVCAARGFVTRPSTHARQGAGGVTVG
jgi:hypothetical protein